MREDAAIGERPPDGAAARKLDAGIVAGALARVRDRLHGHAGDVEIVEIGDNGDVVLSFTGTCTHCPAQALTFGSVILPVLEQLDGIGAVTMRGVNVSRAALRRIRAMAE
jgi:Fe-S cluster biogenesis protein NfuA